MPLVFKIAALLLFLDPIVGGNGSCGVGGDGGGGSSSGENDSDGGGGWGGDDTGGL